MNSENWNKLKKDRDKTFKDYLTHKFDQCIEAKDLKIGSSLPLLSNDEQKFIKNMINTVQASIRGTSKNYDAIRMSESVYNKLVLSCSTFTNVTGNISNEYERFMGLEIFVDYDAAINYFTLGYAEYFRDPMRWIYSCDPNIKTFFLDEFGESKNSIVGISPQRMELLKEGI